MRLFRDGEQEQDHQAEADQAEDERDPDDGDVVGHIQAEEGGEKGEEKEDDDARDALDDDDGRGLDEGSSNSANRPRCGRCRRRSSWAGSC